MGLEELVVGHWRGRHNRNWGLGNFQRTLQAIELLTPQQYKVQHGRFAYETDGAALRVAIGI